MQGFKGDVRGFTRGPRGTSGVSQRVKGNVRVVQGVNKDVRGVRRSRGAPGRSRVG